MKKYDKYKSSGVEWLGAVPEQWEVKRIKNITKSLIGGGTPSTEKDEYWDGIIPWVSAKDMKFDRIIESVDYITEKAIKESSTNLIKPNRILFVARSGILKHTFPVAINSVPVAINQDLKALEPNKLVSVEFLLRCFKGLSSNILMKCQKVGATVDSLEIQEFLNFSIPIPPLPEQSLIATFLDQKTSSIDQKISLLQQKSFHYKDLRKSLINETICRGLNKNVKFKDSGIEWIGKIPEHWEVQRLKELGNIETSSINKKIEENEELFKLVNYTDVYGNKNKELRNNENYMVVSANRKQALSKILKMGDVLFTPSSETIEDIGVSAVVMENLTNTLYSYHILRFRFSKFLDLNYKKYLFNNSFVQYYFSKSASGTTRKILGLNVFNNLPIFYPIDIKEQIEIAKFLDEKTQKIDSILTNIASQIETLKELRKTLINDVVCGKLKVTDND